MDLWLALEVYPVRVKQGLRWVKGKKKKKKEKKGKLGKERTITGEKWGQAAAEERGQFVWARITSSATRNQTAGSLRTWLAGFLLQGGKKKEKKTMVMSPALVGVIDISLSPQWFPAGPANMVFMSAASALCRLHSAQQSKISGHQHLIYVITVS